METFTEPNEFVDDPRFSERREETLAAFDPGSIDEPIRGIVEGLAALPHCFTVQSCCGHFLYQGNTSERTLRPLPPYDCGAVRYRIAYLACCIEPGEKGRSLRDDLERVTAVDPDYIQFGSSSWFDQLHPNTWILQVEPYRFRFSDEAIIGYDEALRVQETRDRFLAQLEEVLQWHLTV